ncbi:MULTISPECIES: PIN domain-containing protein [unclassified Sulfurospirillum]|uniref:type II toxin-antitoxin system VapC family toxin n=1 Tax=unclassified Sulfurospirillum TaxID=2618290 RepID=UPI0005065C43|nr:MULTISPECIES: PIN domain-containing protein [unclassified Sulfurospirillum]KFL33149.1 hypothetical protein JU57_12770 [Sulfurospirillum sp. SCADC]
MTDNAPLIYKINAQDQVFIDTNILIFLFSPSFVSSKQYQVEKYSAIFEKLVEKHCKLYINATVISEFINRCMRLDFDRNFNIDGKKNFKRDYRPSPQYKRTLEIVLKEMKKFLQFANHVNDDFAQFNFIEMLSKHNQSDFNDLIIADTVQKKNFKLLSDDNDFKNLGIDITWYLAH